MRDATGTQGGDVTEIRTAAQKENLYLHRVVLPTSVSAYDVNKDRPQDESLHHIQHR